MESTFRHISNQGCQIYLNSYKNANFGTFWNTLGMAKFGIFRGHLVIVLPFWCIFPFGFLYQEKSGNPVSQIGFGGWRGRNLKVHF
jgi:hypothetical protein